MDRPLIEAHSVSCRRPLGRSNESEIQSLSLSIWAREQVLLCGPPGSGRSLLLHLLGLLESPDSGSIRFDGEPVPAADQSSRSALRNRNFGFVFAAPYLLPDFSVAENVAMPLFKVAGAAPAQADATVQALLEEVGLEGIAAVPAHQVEPSAQFRVALARALALEPRVLVVEAPASGGRGGRDPAFTAALDRVRRARQLTCLEEGDATGAGAPGARSIFLERGRIATGGVRATLA